MEKIELRNSKGMLAVLIPRGATLTEWHVPDREGTLTDIVLGFDDPADYATSANQHFGCTTGRVANRTAGARFELDGKEYQLAANNGPNNLHGGVERSLDKVAWEAELFESSAVQGVKFTYSSPEGEEGFPGNLSIEVTYTLHDIGELRINYEATSDQATPVNLTNHSYFNLLGAGAPSVFDHAVTIYADQYTATDEHQVPTGEVAKVEGTPLDFRTSRTIGERIAELYDSPAGGYDHNYVIRDWDSTLRLAAVVEEPTSGRVLEVETTEPGIQLYTGNGLKNQIGKGGKSYPPRSAFCLETQHFPNAANEPRFPSIILRPGETYHHICVYRAKIDG